MHRIVYNFLHIFHDKSENRKKVNIINKSHFSWEHAY